VFNNASRHSNDVFITKGLREYVTIKMTIVGEVNYK
jgi:hypothetical protein